MANAVDAFLKLNMRNADDVINNYKDILNIDSIALSAEAIIMENMLQLKKKSTPTEVY